jgi:hypothetical protein
MPLRVFGTALLSTIPRSREKAGYQLKKRGEATRVQAFSKVRRIPTQSRRKRKGRNPTSKSQPPPSPPPTTLRPRCRPPRRRRRARRSRAKSPRRILPRPCRLRATSGRSPPPPRTALPCPSPPSPTSLPPNTCRRGPRPAPPTRTPAAAGTGGGTRGTAVLTAPPRVPVPLRRRGGSG